MPMSEVDSRFLVEFQHLTPEQQQLFRDAVGTSVANLRTGAVGKGLRAKRVRGRAGIWERAWADDGRATIFYGAMQQPGRAHVVWRRVGTHDIVAGT